MPRRAHPPRRAPGRPGAWSLAQRFSLPAWQAATPEQVSAIRADPTAWRFDLGWDGHRVLVVREGTEVRLFADDRKEWTQAAQNVALTVAALPFTALVLEGILCLLDEAGRPDFERLRARVATGQGPPPVLMVRQVLHVNGEDLAQPAREQWFNQLPAHPALVPSARLRGTLDDLLAKVAEAKLGPVLATREADGLCVVVAGLAPRRRALSKPPAVTNPDKVLFPRDGITKREVVGWYDEIAAVLLPHLEGRPVVCQRWPDGIDDFTWFQHRPPPRAPDYLDAVTIEGDRRLIIADRDGLVWMANQAALTFHTWATRAGSLQSPDWATIDLDPGTATSWRETIEVARAIHQLLELLEVPSVVKTSGQKGLHVLVPLAPGQSLETAHRFAEGVCRLVARLLPQSTCLTHDEKERRGRLFLDHLQNFRGKTLVAPYSLRAVDGAPVSTPLQWSEVTPALDPRAFTMAVVRRRLDAHGDLFRRVLSDGIELTRPLERLAGR